MRNPARRCLFSRTDIYLFPPPFDERYRSVRLFSSPFTRNPFFFDDGTQTERASLRELPLSSGVLVRFATFMKGPPALRASSLLPIAAPPIKVVRQALSNKGFDALPFFSPGADLLPRSRQFSFTSSGATYSDSVGRVRRRALLPCRDRFLYPPLEKSALFFFPRITPFSPPDFEVCSLAPGSGRAFEKPICARLPGRRR